jgi:hypothetical protein
MRKIRIHSYAPSTIIEFLDSYKRSHDRPRAYLGTQALFAYYPVFNFANGWCSVHEMLSGPEPGKRSPYKIDAYVPITYVRWMDQMSGRAIDYIDDLSPDNLARIEEKYGSRLKQVRDRSLHLKRAMIIYYKISKLNPDILEIDLDLIRPEGYEDRYHCFQDLDYLFGYTEKLVKLINVDLSKPSGISLTEY